MIGSYFWTHDIYIFSDNLCYICPHYTLNSIENYKSNAFMRSKKLKITVPFISSLEHFCYEWVLESRWRWLNDGLYDGLNDGLSDVWMMTWRKWIVIMNDGLSKLLWSCVQIGKQDKNRIYGISLFMSPSLESTILI